MILSTEDIDPGKIANFTTFPANLYLLFKITLWPNLFTDFQFVWTKLFERSNWFT